MAAELIIAGIFLALAIGLMFGIRDIAKKAARRRYGED